MGVDVQSGPNSAESVPNSAKSGRFRPTMCRNQQDSVSSFLTNSSCAPIASDMNSTRFRQALVGFGRSQPNLDQVLPDVGRTRANLARFRAISCRFRPRVGRFLSMVCRFRAHLGLPKLSEFGPVFTHLVQIPTNLLRISTHVGRFHQMRSDFGQTWAKVAKFQATRAVGRTAHSHFDEIPASSRSSDLGEIHISRNWGCSSPRRLRRGLARSVCVFLADGAIFRRIRAGKRNPIARPCSGNCPTTPPPKTSGRLHTRRCPGWCDSVSCRGGGGAGTGFRRREALQLPQVRHLAMRKFHKRREFLTP